MQSLPQQFEEVPIDRLRCHPRNPRRGNIDVIEESLQQNGWYGTVVAQKSTGYILAGNHRYLAARKQRAQVIPVLWLDVDDEKALRILLVDNHSSDLAGQDEDQLRDLLEEMARTPTGLLGTGFDQQAFESLLTAPPRDESDEASDQSEDLVDRFEILITCDDEPHQARLLAKFESEGIRCRALLA